jgi:hypothetical protein
MFIIHFSANCSSASLVTRYQHYVFGNFVKSPKTSNVGIVTLNGFSGCQNLLKP